MIYGFTGTRDGMTPIQRMALGELLQGDSFTDQFHHGGCRGADTQAHATAACLAARIIHPGDEERYSFWDSRNDYRELLEPKAYLDRNHDIVNICDVLIAAPRTLTEELRSGTWATVRYARKLGVPVIILDPGGKS